MSSLLLVAICYFSMVLSVYADSDTDSEYTKQSTFWHWYAGDGKSLNEFIGYTFGYVCAISEDGYHHASSIDITSTGGTYSTSTRPTSITGNYGIIGDNRQITQVTDNSSIVNETTNQFFNPASGESIAISDWSYNYEDRSYTVTTENGDTVTVTYGDENITIVQGGDT